MQRRSSVFPALIISTLLLTAGISFQSPFAASAMAAPQTPMVINSCISPTNLALQRSATQSSTLTFAGIVADASRAVDGNTDGVFLHGSVSHTFIDTHGWWQVDLDTRRSIENIEVYNRTDCCADQLSNYYVFVSDRCFESPDLSATINQPGVSSYFQPEQAGHPTTITVNRTGRYVRIQASGTN